MMKLFLSDLDGTLIDVHGNIQEQDVYLSAKGRETLRFWQNEKEGDDRV